MKTTKVLDIANYFIIRANEKAENDLTNLKLQKILYFAQGTYLGKMGANTPLFAEPIEAWKLGPVVRDVYNTFSVCGASPITLLDIPDSSATLPVAIQNELSKIWDEYGKFSASYLVDLTHKQSPWLENYDEGSKNTIPQIDMALYFSLAK